MPYKLTINKILSREPKSFVSCSHMNCCLQKYTTHQFTYYIFIYFKTNLNIQKLLKSNKYIKRYMQNYFLLFYLDCFLLATHLNLKQLKKCDSFSHVPT